jgi:hypothetical protein
LIYVPERRCSNGKLAYEKTTGFELIRASPTRLFTSKDGGIIADCASRYFISISLETWESRLIFIT